MSATRSKRSQAEIASAYSHCEAVTRAQAANFFYGIRLLPGERRRAMCAVYAFARRVDDIGDGTLERQEKLRRLDGAARALIDIAPNEATRSIRDGDPADAVRVVRSDVVGAAGVEDPVIVALADAQRRFPLPVDALGELIEGVRMDVTGVTYESFDDLVVYCRRVAGAIGRLCLAIFGLRTDAGADWVRAEGLADDLGVALQLTNILRDLREDAEIGRVYLPAEDLRRFGLIAEDPAGATRSVGPDSAAGQPGAPELLSSLARALASPPDGPVGEAEQLAGLCALVRFECERAREWFDRGIALTAMLDRRSAACVLAMAGIYRRLLERIDARPEQAMRRRMSLPAHEKAWVAARGMLGVRA